MGRVIGARVAVLLAAVLLVLAACVTSSSPGTSASRTIPPSGGLAASEGPGSPVVGTVASVDPPAPASPAASPPAASPSKASAKPAKTPAPTPPPSAAPVKGFTLLTAGGETLAFVIGQLDNAADFPSDSLYDRLTGGDPIRVFFTVDGTRLVVYHIEDAG